MEENQQAVPHGWVVIENLSSYGKVYNGLSGKTKDDFGEGEPYIPYVNVFKNSKIDRTELGYVKIKRGESQNRVIYGDLIFTTSSETIEEVGMTSVFLEKGISFYLNSFCFIYRLNNFKHLLPEFSQFLFRSDRVRYQITLLGQGSTRYNLSKTRLLKELTLTIPKSKKEQQKISEVLSKLDQAIYHTEALIGKYKRIKTGLMQELLANGIDTEGNIRSETTHEFWDSPLGRIPIGWDCLPLEKLYDLKSGITPLRSIKKYFSREGFNWVKTLDLNEDDLFETEEKVTQFALENTSLKLMPINSVLIAMYGGWEQIGRTSILKKEAGTNQAITCLYNPRIDISSEYVQLFLQQFRYKWKQYAVSTRKDPNITKEDIRNFFLAFPKEVDEQNEIAEKIRSVKKHLNNNKKQLLKLQSLKAGLMQDLLSGKVRVNHLIQENQPA